MGQGLWFEPTAGFRYTFTDYGDDAAALGLQDGKLWRVQAGARIGTGGYYDGYRWTLSLAGILYDDVSISGFVTDAASLSSGAAIVDQGKLRALGQFAGTLSDGSGLSYTLQLEVRGGEDVVGVGGKVGLRYQW